MREGKNREVKNVLGHLGLAVNRLIRVSFGPFQLGDLAEGAIEEVKTRTLREQLGERIAALAGADFSATRSSSVRRPFSQRRTVSSPSERRKPAIARTSRPDACRAQPRTEVRVQPRAPQDDEARNAAGHASRASNRARDAERFGEPELARRERKATRPPVSRSGKKR